MNEAHSSDCNIHEDEGLCTCEIENAWLTQFRPDFSGVVVFILALLLLLICGCEHRERDTTTYIDGKGQRVTVIHTRSDTIREEREVPVTRTVVKQSTQTQTTENGKLTPNHLHTVTPKSTPDTSAPNPVVIVDPK